MLTRLFAVLMIFAAVFALAAPHAGAQQTNALGATAASGTLGGEEKAPPPLSEEEKEERRQPFRYSLFFSAEDLLAIGRAQKGISVSPGQAGGDKIPQVRKIRLAGILYFSPQHWMIWLNGDKVTPWVQPEEIKDIQVHPGWIDLEWFDIGANHVIKIQMPANSEYDIVTGILLADPTPPVLNTKR